MVHETDDPYLPEAFSVLCAHSPNSDVRVLMSSTSECDLIQEQSHYRGNQVKMKSLEWTLIRYDQCPYKKGKCGERHTHGEDAWQT